MAESGRCRGRFTQIPIQNTSGGKTVAQEPRQKPRRVPWQPDPHVDCKTTMTRRVACDNEESIVHGDSPMKLQESSIKYRTRSGKRKVEAEISRLKFDANRDDDKVNSTKDSEDHSHGKNLQDLSTKPLTRKRKIENKLMGCGTSLTSGSQEYFGSDDSPPSSPECSPSPKFKLYIGIYEQIQKLLKALERIRKDDPIPSSNAGDLAQQGQTATPAQDSNLPLNEDQTPIAAEDPDSSLNERQSLTEKVSELLKESRYLEASKLPEELASTSQLQPNKELDTLLLKGRSGSKISAKLERMSLRPRMSLAGVESSGKSSHQDSSNSPKRRQSELKQTNGYESAEHVNKGREWQNGSSSTFDSSKRRRSSRNQVTINHYEELDAEVDVLTEEARRTKKISRCHQHDLTVSFAKKIVLAINKLSAGFQLDKLKLRDCGISADFLRTLLKGAENGEIQIRALDLSGNKNLDMQEVKNLAHILNSTELDLSATDPDKNQLKILENMKIQVLKLRYNTFEDETIATTLAKLFENGLENLVLDDCKISDQQLEKLAETLKRTITFKHLDLSHISLGIKGIEAVSQIVNKTNGMIRVVLTDCGLSKELLEILEKFTIQKICELAINSNPRIAESGVGVVAKLVKKLKCEELDISSNNLTGKHIKELLAAAAAPKQVRTLLLSESVFGDWSEVARLVVRWGVETLDITECRMDAEDIKDFAQALGRHELKSVDLSHPDEIVVDEKKEKALNALGKKSLKVFFGNHKEW